MNEKTLIELREDIRSKKISSMELTKFYLDRIKKYDDKLNSFITITEEHALERAKIADSEIAKGKVKKLTGLPIAQKDIFCTKGIKTTCGSFDNSLKGLLNHGSSHIRPFTYFGIKDSSSLAI